jgi:hypothetical protein
MSARDDLIEAAATAWRARDSSGAIRPSGAWFDLDAEGRREAHDAAAQARILEAALDPDGLSTTARGVLARCARADRGTR